VKFSTGIFEDDRKVVENHFNILAQKISTNLTRTFGAEVYIGNIEYNEGSVKVSGRVLVAWLFITPIIQGYAVNQIPPLKSKFVAEAVSKEDSKKEYDITCKTVEKITIQTIEQHEKRSDLKSHKVTITTRDIEKVCQEWVSTQKH
jgi:hypothetical protein